MFESGVRFSEDNRLSRRDTSYSFVQNETNWLLRNFPRYKKPTGNILCPKLKCLDGTKSSNTEERTSMVNIALDERAEQVHHAGQVLELQTKWLKFKRFWSLIV